MLVGIIWCVFVMCEFFFSSRRRQTRCALVTGVQTCALPIFGGVDGGRALVLDHVARHEVAPVRGGVEEDVGRAALDAAFQHRLQRLVAGILAVEAEVVAEQDAGPVHPAQVAEQAGQGGNVLRSEEHTSELQSLMRISYAVFCLKKKKTK